MAKITIVGAGLSGMVVAINLARQGDEVLIPEKETQFCMSLKCDCCFLGRGEDRLFYNAATIMLVCADRWDETSGLSCAAALYNCSLMGHTIGIGCCFNGFVQNTVNSTSKIRKWGSAFPGLRSATAR